jgi:hypothetical protein
MSALLQQQQAMLDALFAWPAAEATQRLSGLARGVGSHAPRGLMAYQANGHMLAERALQAVYPVVAHMLGSESFGQLARALWHTNPPARGDVAQWGAVLADFIAQSAQLQEEAYLPDVARVEWMLHGCASAKDRDADWTPLALLTTEDPNALTLQLAPGTQSLASAWPVASLWLAHTAGVPTFAEVGEQLRRGTPQDAVVWRQGLQPQLREALPGECALLGALQSGKALGAALDASSGLDFSRWLPLAVQTGLVLRARQLPTNKE